MFFPSLEVALCLKKPTIQYSVKTPHQVWTKANYYFDIVDELQKQLSVLKTDAKASKTNTLAERLAIKTLLMPDETVSENGHKKG